MKKYPETLGEKRLDPTIWDYFKEIGYDDGRPNWEVAKDVKKLAKKENAQMYTAIDGSGTRIIWMKGDRWVNRLGLWIVVRKDGLVPDNS